MHDPTLKNLKNLRLYVKKKIVLVTPDHIHFQTKATLELQVHDSEHRCYVAAENMYHCGVNCTELIIILSVFAHTSTDISNPKIN